MPHGKSSNPPKKENQLKYTKGKVRPLEQLKEGISVIINRIARF